MGWIEFALSMIVFMASHRIPAALGAKDALVNRFGGRGYTVVFSIVSSLLLWWVIVAAGRAPVVTLWYQTPLARWAVNVAMPIAIALSAFGIAAPNPFAFEGRASGFDPAHPGIAGVTRQPLLWALLLWSGAHLWANGDLAHVILFATFALFAGVGMKIVETRRRRAMGPQDWARLRARTGLFPLAALVAGRWKPAHGPKFLRLAIALTGWGILWHLHAPVIGVSPAP